MMGNPNRPSDSTCQTTARNSASSVPPGRTESCSSHKGPVNEANCEEHLIRLDENDALLLFPTEPPAPVPDAVSLILGSHNVGSGEPVLDRAADVVVRLSRVSTEVAGQLRDLDRIKIELQRELTHIEQLRQATSTTRRQAEKILRGLHPPVSSSRGLASLRRAATHRMAALRDATAIGTPRAVLEALKRLAQRSTPYPKINPAGAAVSRFTGGPVERRSYMAVSAVVMVSIAWLLRHAIPASPPVSGAGLLQASPMPLTSNISVPTVSAGSINPMPASVTTQRSGGVRLPGPSAFDRPSAGLALERVADSSLTAPAEDREGVFLGGLAINSDPPGAMVLLDRHLMGRTPTNMAKTRAGSHLVWIERAGYVRWTSVVTVIAEKTTSVKAKLEADATP
jgi:hypothetical protein